MCVYTIAHAHVYVCVLSHCECDPFTSCVGEGAHMYMSFPPPPAHAACHNVCSPFNQFAVHGYCTVEE